MKKNLSRFGVADDVTLINRSSFDAETISEVHQTIGSGGVALFIFDADNNVRRDLDCYGDLLADACWLVVDDYFGPAKAAPIRAQVDTLCVRGSTSPVWILRVGRLGRPVAVRMNLSQSALKKSADHP